MSRKPLPLSCLEYPLGNGALEEIIEKAKDWCLMHGGAMKPRDPRDGKDLLILMPSTLLPTVVPEIPFKESLFDQTLFNELYHRVSQDHEFLAESLKKTVEADEFTRKLFEIYTTVRNEGVRQSTSLGLFRSDYMEDLVQSDSGLAETSFKQVEMNTVSVSMSPLGSVSTCLHRYVLGELGRKDLLKHLPDNPALESVAKAMVEAWRLFADERGVILFVVEDYSYNICDQRMIEYEIGRQEEGARVMRRSFKGLEKDGFLDPLTRDYSLGGPGGDKVALVYYRTGYDPSHYPTQRDWEIRLDLERSTAIKCPSIQYHLAGTKKIQQVLCQPRTVEKYIKDPNDVSKIRSYFTEMYSLDEGDVTSEEGYSLALSDPSSYVLKPQREGGGHNLYGEEVGKKCEQMMNRRRREKGEKENGKIQEEEESWILMKRLKPRETENYLLNKGVGRKGSPIRLISELGIFGAVIGDSKQIYLNVQCGHVLRSKTPETDEGGVAAGYAAIDSPFLL